MSLLHTNWIKPNSKIQALWITKYLNKKQIVHCSISPESNAELIKKIMEGEVATEEQRKKMASAWTSHVNRAKKKADIKALAKAQKKNQITITISKHHYSLAKCYKNRKQDISTYIEQLISEAKTQRNQRSKKSRDIIPDSI